jgi:hypothetical protein
MRCPVCHCNVTTFIETDQIDLDLHPHLTIKCPQWKKHQGICFSCLDTIEMANDEVLQSILNGTTGDQDDQIFTYALSNQEEPYWCHIDPTVQSWFRSELRRRVHHLASGGNHATWRIVDTDRRAVDEGEV